MWNIVESSNKKEVGGLKDYEMIFFFKLLNHSLFLNSYIKQIFKVLRHHRQKLLSPNQKTNYSSKLRTLIEEIWISNNELIIFFGFGNMNPNTRIWLQDNAIGSL